jgi:hypothetical protein
MALKFKYQTKAEIPAEQAGLYIERDGSWVLDAEGVVEKTRLEEFRANNTELLKERDELRQRFEGIDPEEVRRVAEEKRKLEEAAQLKAGEVDKVIDARVRAVKTELEKQLALANGERQALTARLTAIQIDQAVVSEATKRGLRTSAAADILARARSVLRLVNGAPVVCEADGQTARMGKDGVTPMALAEWLDTQVSEAPHLFEANAGGGAASSGSGGAASRYVRNPFRKESWNLTEQMKLQRTDPELAARLVAMAG